MQSDLLSVALNGGEMEAEIFFGKGAEVDWKDPSEVKPALHLTAKFDHRSRMRSAPAPQS